MRKLIWLPWIVLLAAVVFLFAPLIPLGYDVAELGSETDQRVQELVEGQIFTLSELTDTECSVAGIVGAYASNSDRNEVIGRAGVSMAGQELFVLLATFDNEGNRLRSTRVSRVPFDMNGLSHAQYDCTAEFQARDGVIELVE